MKRERLPNGWEWKLLGEIAEVNPGFVPGSFSDSTEVSFVPMGCVAEVTGKIDTSEIRSLGEVKKGYTPIQEGDLLVAKITPCMENGKIAVAQGLKNGLGFASTEFHVLRFSSVVSSRLYMKYLLQDRLRKQAARSMTGSAGQKRVPTGFLENLVVPYPPFEVQCRILTILEKAGSARLSRARADALALHLSGGIYMEMLGDPIKNAMRWDKISIADLVDGDHGVSCGPFGSQLKIGEYVREGVLVVGIDNVQKDEFIWAKSKFITTKKLAQLKAFEVKARDVLITRTGTVGRSCVLPEGVGQAVIGPNLLKVSFDDNRMLPEVFSAAMNFFPSVAGEIGKISPGATVAVLNTGNLKALEIAVPPIGLQRQFVQAMRTAREVASIQRQSDQEIDMVNCALEAKAFNGGLVA